MERNAGGVRRVIRGDDNVVVGKAEFLKKLGGV